MRAFQLGELSNGRRKGKNSGKGKEKSRTKRLGLSRVCGQDEEEEPASRPVNGAAEQVEKREGG